MITAELYKVLSMRKYNQLTQEQRYHIVALKKIAVTQSFIANEIGVHKSTVSRELMRNTSAGGYDAKDAQKTADTKRSLAKKHLKMNSVLQGKIVKKLKQDWSPEQISGRFKLENEASISHETIYQYILRDKKASGTLYKSLRHAGKKYKKRYGSHDRQGQIKNKVSIEQRPAIVEERKYIGDWEIDLVMGKDHQGALVTIVDRVSKLTLIAKVASKHAEGVTAATIKLMTPYIDFSQSITADNGKEFAGHEEMAKALGINFYFAHPYSSCERGTNENTNGLIRQYVPKGCSFDDVTNRTAQRIMRTLNNRPRKALDYKTPNEFLFELIGRIAA